MVARLDVAVTIALAVLGVLVGIALGREIRTALRLFVAASLESAVTIAFVTGATIYFTTATGVPLERAGRGVRACARVLRVGVIGGNGRPRLRAGRRSGDARRGPR